MTDSARFTFEAELFLWDGEMPWIFVALPPDLADEITARFESVAVGFGSIRVEVTIGGSRWATSLFPDNKRGTYLLPIKAPVRRAEGIEDGDRVSVTLRVGDVAPAPARGSRRSR